VIYKLTFTSIKQAMELNNLNEAEIVKVLHAKMENDNYRTNYNKEKNQALATPEAKAFLKKVREARKSK
jgi:hypothetical protein